MSQCKRQQKDNLNTKPKRGHQTMIRRKAGREKPRYASIIVLFNHVRLYRDTVTSNNYKYGKENINTTLTL